MLLNVWPEMGALIGAGLAFVGAGIALISLSVKGW